MSYRFTRITNYYPQYLNLFYKKKGSVVLKTYKEHHNELVEDSYEIASCYTKNLNKIGVIASVIISNADELQKAWKKENKISGNTSGGALIINQLNVIQPDVVWIDDFSFFNREWKDELYDKVPSVKLILGHVCAPFNFKMEEKFKLVDIMFTCTPCFKKQLETLGIKAYLLYHGFETSVLDNINVDNRFPESDFLFSGSLYTGSGFHKDRIEFIQKILDAEINIDLYCNLESWKRIAAKKATNTIIKGIKKVGAGKLVDRIPILKKYRKYGETNVNHYSSRLLKRVRPPVFGYDMYKVLSKAKAVFNMHGEVAQKCAGNIRLFEATGMGACLVTDWKENIGELFEPEKEIITYRSVEECIDKIRWLLQHDNERKKIALAGQKRTLSQHSVAKRAEQLNKIIQDELTLRRS